MANDFTLDSNCVALWKFENNALTVDDVGGNTLVATNSPTADTADYQEGAGCVDLERSSNQYFSVADSNLDAAFPFKNGGSYTTFSICAWIKLEESNNFLTLCAKQNSGSSFRIVVNSGSLDLMFYNVSWSTYSFGTSLSLNTWYHIGCTYDGSDQSYRIRVWDDTAGALLGTDVTGTSAKTPVATTDPWRIGTTNANIQYAFDGRIDELVVFNDVLTADEIDLIRLGAYGKNTTDFREYTTGIQPPDWSAYTNGGNFQTFEASDILAGGGGRALRLGNTSNALSSAKLDGALTNKSDVEVLVKCKTTDIDTQGSNYILVRGDAEGVKYKAYGGTDGWYGAGTDTSLKVAGTEGDWFWVRFRANGTTAYLKVWTGPYDDEPGSWDTSWTIGSGSGPATLGHYDSGGDSYFGFFSIAYDGDTAPGPDSIEPSFTGNDFSNDQRCVSLYNFNLSADGAGKDYQGTNFLTEVNTVALPTADYKQGDAALDLEYANSERLRIDDADLSSNFPFKSGTNNDKISICCWVKKESTQYCPIFAKGAAGSTTHSFKLWAQYSSLKLEICNGSTSESYTYPTSLSNAIWYHIAFTYDATTMEYRLRVWDDNAQDFLDDDLVGVGTISAQLVTGYFYIGESGQGLLYYWDGLIDEAVIFNEILSTTEIDLIRNGQYGQPEENNQDFLWDNSCVACYHFESGALTTDETGKNALTAYNTPTAETDYFKQGGGSIFLSTNQYLVVGSPSSDFPLYTGDTRKQITMAGWFKPLTLGTKWRYLMGSAQYTYTGRVGIGLSINSASLLYVNFCNSSDYSTQITLSTGIWYHISLSFDDAQNLFRVRVFDDTNKTYKTFTQTSLGAVSVGSASFTIGDFPGSSGAYNFEGLIDEVVVFNRFLSDAEMAKIRKGIYGSTPLPTIFNSDPRCVALWELEPYGYDMREDTIGGNRFDTEGIFPNPDTADYKEGAGCAFFPDSPVKTLTVSNSNLDLGFPFKSAPNGPTKITFCAWIKPTAWPSLWQTIFCKRTTVTTMFAFYISSTGQLRLGLSAFATWYTASFDTNLTVNKWYHVAFTYDATSNNYRIRVWDHTAGALLDDDKTGTSTETVPNNTAPVYLGSIDDSTSYNFVGKIDQAAVFNDILTADEIDNIRANSAPTRYIKTFEKDVVAEVPEYFEDGSWDTWGTCYWEIANSYYDEAYGGKTLHYHDGATGRYALKYTPLGDAIDDCEVLIRFMPHWPTTHQEGVIVLRGSGTGAGENGYLITVYNATTFYIIELNNGTWTVRDSATITNVGAYWHWIRARVVNDGTGQPVIQARIWAEGASEPATWSIEWTDTAKLFATGWVGLAGVTNEYWDVDYFSVSTVPDTEGAVAQYYDNFTGTNGNSINADRWTTDISTFREMDIQSNAIRVHSTGMSSVWGNAVAGLKNVVFSGDFTVQIDFDIQAFLATDLARFGLWVSDTAVTPQMGSVNSVMMNVCYNTDDIYFASREYVSGTGGTITYSASALSGTTGKLRLRRNGSTVYAGYIDDIGDWVELQSYTLSGDLYMIFGCYYKPLATDDMDIRFDNFVVTECDLESTWAFSAAGGEEAAGGYRPAIIIVC